MLRAEIIGNLGQDAAVKNINGKNYVSMSVAHSQYSKDQSGNKIESTLWVSVLWFGEGGNLIQYLKKGTKVFIRGRQTIKMYDDKTGRAQIGITIDATEVELCGMKQEQSAATQEQQQPQQAKQEYQPTSGDGNDDMPF